MLNFGYGTVFEATDETRRLAIKTEKYSKSMLRIEAGVLKTATQANCTRIVEFIEYISVSVNATPGSPFFRDMSSQAIAF